MVDDCILPIVTRVAPVAQVDNTWGDVGYAGAWQLLNERLTVSARDDIDTRLALSAQTWFQAAVVRDMLSHRKDRWIYEFAGWMRQMSVAFRGPEALANLDTEAYQRLWQGTYPPGRVFQSQSDLVTQLEKTAHIYDEESLCAEIGTWPGTRAYTSVGEIAKLRQVPKLDVHTSLAEEDLNRCLRTFIVFLRWPQPKDAAWARFSNNNPIVSTNDLESITIFYRQDTQYFSFGAKRASGDLYPDIYKVIPYSALCTTQSMAEL